MTNTHEISFHFLITCVFVSLIVVVVLLIGASSYQIAKNNQISIYSKAALSSLLLTSSYLDSRIANEVATIVNIYNTTQLQTALKESATYGLSSSAYVGLSNYLESIFNKDYSYIDSLVVYIESDNPVLISTGNYHVYSVSPEWEKLGLSKKGSYKIKWRPLEQDSLINANGVRDNFGIYFYGISDTGIRYVIMLDIKSTLIKNAVDNILTSYSTPVFFVSSDSYYSLRGDDEILHDVDLKDESGICRYKNTSYVYSSLKTNSWKIVVCLDNETILAGLMPMKILIFAIILILGLSSVIIGIVISKLVSRPLEKLATKVSNIDLDNIDNSTSVKMNSKITEILLLSNNIDSLLSRVNLLIKDVEKRQNESLIMQNRLLLAQINPHFLYNTLYAIAQKCALGDTNEATEMLFELSAFFRFGLSSGKEFIALSDEMAHVENYLKLISRGFAYELKYEIRLHPELNSLMIPKMTLQPIVENSFKHGIKQQRRDGFIFIEATTVDKNAIITVKDNGVGIDDETMERLNHELQFGSERKNGFGMYNINQRIKNYFGDNYGVTVSSALGKGTIVTITIPINLEMRNEEN